MNAVLEGKNNEDEEEMGVFVLWINWTVKPLFLLVLLVMVVSSVGVVWNKIRMKRIIRKKRKWNWKQRIMLAMAL